MPFFFIIIVNDITNFCFRFLPKPYTGAFAGPKTKFLMSLTIKTDILNRLLRSFLQNRHSLYRYERMARQEQATAKGNIF